LTIKKIYNIYLFGLPFLKKMKQEMIVLHGARQNNLKNINIEIPKNKLVVITGPSGSGKSSLAFDTIYTEGRRRYVESLSSYARQFLNIQDKPDFDSITGLSPAIAIDQKTSSRNPRSTVATMTEIYDYLRILYSRVGVPYSPATGLPIESKTSSEIIGEIMELPSETRIVVLAPVVRGKKGEHKKLLISLRRQGFQRCRFNGIYMDLEAVEIADKNLKHTIEVVIDRIEIDENIKERLANAVETGLSLGEGLLGVEFTDLPTQTKTFTFKIGKKVKEGETIIFSEKFSCPVSGFTLEEVEPRIFSFNSPYGACEACDGLGTEYYFTSELIIPDPELSINEGTIAPWGDITRNKHYHQILEGMAKHYGFFLQTPYRDLPDKIRQLILYGTNGEEFEVEYLDGIKRTKFKSDFKGIINILNAQWKETDSEVIKQELEKYQDITSCHKCEGYRLRPTSLCVKIDGIHIGELCKKSIEDTITWVEEVPEKLTERQNAIAEKILKEIYKRLNFLKNVGLDYLTLSRESGTLSGGESQRIRLASQIGSELTGVMYVLDEPSIGLHQSDNTKLINTLKHLRDIGNSVIVVEHDEETMMEADYLIDIGPGAGEHGGHVVAFGTPREMMEHPDSITGKYLSGRECITGLGARRKYGNGKFIEIIGARVNNLKNIDVKIPLGLFTCVTGVSGGGKSSLVIHTLYKAIARKFHQSAPKPGLHEEIKGLEHIDKIVEIDQSPIGRTPRSNPATYTATFTHIREWFANLPDSRRRGYKPSRFSFNVKGGRCEACQGDGIVKVEMHFLPDVYVPCEVCKGAKYNKETLEIKYMGKSISDVLNMSIKDAFELFKPITVISEKIKSLMDVGLDYMTLGQSATTLSGGESQRIKLSRELSKKETGNTLYILDEPTTGLHSSDIKKLLEVLQTLVDQGNSLVVIEHNMDVIKTADYLIDIGPLGGAKGGKLVAQGTPEEVAKVKDSLTGQSLVTYLKKMQDYQKKNKRD
jgi:excinuclease ABC subunit A